MTSSYDADSSELALTRVLQDARTHALVRRGARVPTRTQRMRQRQPTQRSEALPARVAVVGGGAAGIATAYELTRRGFHVELYEAAAQLGGNCGRVVVPGPDGAETSIDVGVSDFNRRTFHRFSAFIDALGLEARPICEDATTLFHDGQTATTTLAGRLWSAAGPTASAQLALEVQRFMREVPAVSTAPGAETLGAYLARMRYSEAFKSLYARPRAAGCIVMPDRDPDEHDLASLMRTGIAP